MVEMFVGGAPSEFGSEWVAALWGLFLNVAVSMTALVVGQHLALALQNWYTDGGEVKQQPHTDAEAVNAVQSQKQQSTLSAAHVNVQLTDVTVPQDATSTSPPSAAVHNPEQQTGQDIPAAVAPKAEAVVPSAPARPLICYAMDLLVLIILLFLTAISIGYAIIEGKTSQASSQILTMT